MDSLVPDPFYTPGSAVLETSSRIDAKNLFETMGNERPYLRVQSSVFGIAKISWFSHAESELGPSWQLFAAGFLDLTVSLLRNGEHRVLIFLESVNA